MPKLHRSGARLRRSGSGRLMIATGVPTAATSLTLDEYDDGHVFQRVGNAKVVTVSGGYTGPAMLLEARVAPHGIGLTSLPDAFPWAALAASFVGGDFIASLTVPEGGWYNLQIRDGVDHAIAAAGTRKLGVGPWFVRGGQSLENHHCVNAESYPLSNDLVRRHAGGGWKRQGNYHPTLPPGTTYPYGGASVDQSAGDTTGDSSAGGRGDGIVTFSNIVAAALNMPIAILPYAIVGTDIASWLPGGSSWNAMVAGMADIGTDFEEFDLDIGQSNAAAGTSKASFKASLTTFLQALWTLTGRDATNFRLGIRLIGPTVSYGAEGSFAIIRQAQIEFIEENASNGVYMLSNPSDADLSDGVHYVTTPTQVRNGRRDARSALFQQGIGTSGAEGPKIVGATYSGSVLTINVAQADAGGLVDGAGGAGATLGGIRVYDADGAKTISSSALSGNTIVLTAASAFVAPVTFDYCSMNLPFGEDPDYSSIIYGATHVSGDTLGLPLQPCALMAAT